MTLTWFQTTPLSSLDYENRSPLSLVITAIDGGQPGQSVVKTFSINVTDINEQPTDVILSSNEVTLSHGFQRSFIAGRLYHWLVNPEARVRTLAEAE